MTKWQFKFTRPKVFDRFKCDVPRLRFLASSAPALCSCLAQQHRIAVPATELLQRSRRGSRGAESPAWWPPARFLPHATPSPPRVVVRMQDDDVAGVP